MSAVTEVRYARPGRVGRYASLDPRPPTAEALGLIPHPEGGWFRETWRAEPSCTPAGYPGRRAAATAIYFLLPPGTESCWHTVRSDEVWLWHAGDPLTLLLGGTGPRPAAEPAVVTLGPALRRLSGLSRSCGPVAGSRPARPVTGIWSAASSHPASTSPTSPPSPPDASRFRLTSPRRQESPGSRRGLGLIADRYVPAGGVGLRGVGQDARVAFGDAPGGPCPAAASSTSTAIRPRASSPGITMPSPASRGTLDPHCRPPAARCRRRLRRARRRRAQPRSRHRRDRHRPSRHGSRPRR